MVARIIAINLGLRIKTQCWLIREFTYISRSSGLTRGPRETLSSAMNRNHWVYILASRRNGTLYIGVTNNLPRHIHAHRSGEGSTFTKTHNIKRLVWYERHDDLDTARRRERNLKRWRRSSKLKPIEDRQS